VPAPGHFMPGKDPVPIVRSLSGPQGRCGWKILPPPGFDPWTVHPVASHYTECTIPALSGTPCKPLFQRFELLNLSVQYIQNLEIYTYNSTIHGLNTRNKLVT